MVCRTTQVGSAITSLVIQQTALEEQQVLSLYHEVMREGRDHPTPSPGTIQRRIGHLRTLTRLADLSEARTNSILRRLDRAENESMDGQRYYATSRLMARAERAETALNIEIGNLARDLGITEPEARTRLHSLRNAAQEDRNLRPTAGYVDSLRNDGRSRDLPLDRQTAYAIQTMRAAAQSSRRSQPSRPTVRAQVVTGSRAIHAIGYDPTTGRCEVFLHSNPEVGYAYRMSQAEYDEFIGADSLGGYFATRVRANPAYRYDTAESAAADGTQTRCPSCGEFAGTTHACPPRGSTEEMNRAVRQATEAARSAATGTPVANAAPIDLRALRHRRYRGDSGVFSTPNLTEARSHARMGLQQGRPVRMPVFSTISRIAGSEGAERIDPASVSGSVEVAYNGRGRGYTVTPMTGADDPNQNLRCACVQYRQNYDCPHIRQTIQDLNTRINQDSLAAQHTIGPALEQVNADLAQDRADSVAAQRTARETWSPSETVSYSEDPAAFQADYDAAKQRAANGEQVIPYMRENATDGLGARDGGRAFGVEIEFDIAPGRDRRQVLNAIGRALHEAGLTRTASQQGYHSADRRGYTENHNGGWSFEDDCTVAGEIVSPIMYDEPQTWDNLATVMRIVRENGGVATTGTGAHVHVSTHNYDHTVENHNRLMSTFAENEDLIYRLSTNPERGTHRGPRWCRPNSVPSSGYRTVGDASGRNNSHGLGMNLQSVHGRDSDHVEFRTFDGSLDPSVMQAQVKLALGITEAAFREAGQTPSAERSPLGSNRAHNRAQHGASRRITGDAWKQNTAGFRALADKIFRRPEDKAQLTALFQQTKWQRSTH